VDDRRVINGMLYTCKPGSPGGICATEPDDHAIDRSCGPPQREAADTATARRRSPATRDGLGVAGLQQVTAAKACGIRAIRTYLRRRGIACTHRRTP